MSRSRPRGTPGRALPALAALLLLAAPAHAAVIRYTAELSGTQATPRNTSPGNGTITADIDEAAHTMRLVMTFQDLEGTTTAAHVHGPTPTPGSGSALPMTPTPSLPGFPLGVTAGSYDRIYDLTSETSYNADFIASAGGTVADAEALLVQSLAEGRVFFNLHTSVYATGEITGFFGAGTVPTRDIGWGDLRARYRQTAEGPSP